MSAATIWVRSFCSDMVCLSWTYGDSTSYSMSGSLQGGCRSCVSGLRSQSSVWSMLTADLPVHNDIDFRGQGQGRDLWYCLNEEQSRLGMR